MTVDSDNQIKTETKLRASKDIVYDLLEIAIPQLDNNVDPEKNAFLEANLKKLLLEAKNTDKVDECLKIITEQQMQSLDQISQHINQGAEEISKEPKATAELQREADYNTLGMVKPAVEISSQKVAVLSQAKGMLQATKLG